MVEHAAVNRRVVGSSPTSGANFIESTHPELRLVCFPQLKQFPRSQIDENYHNYYEKNNDGSVRGCVGS